MSSTEKSDSPAPRRFATTCWTEVFQAANRENSGGQAALDSLCHQYWYPLYSFIRRKGYTAADAEDLTQAFFQFLLEKDNLAKADQMRGKFRTFLLTSLTNFLANQHRAEQSKKRNPAAAKTVDYQSAEQRYQLEPIDQLSPERIFDRAWAITLLQSAMEELRNHYQELGKSELYDQLSPFLVRESENTRYAELALELGKSTSAIKVLIHRMRERSRRILRRKIGETVDSESQIDQEINELFEIFKN